MNPYSFILETIQVQSKSGNVDGRFVSHKTARKASGLTGLTAKAMKKFGGESAQHFSKARDAFRKQDLRGGNYNSAKARQIMHFGRAERAEGNGNYDEANAHDHRARFFGDAAKAVKNG